MSDSLFDLPGPGSLTDPLQHPAQYRLFLGNRSASTARISLTAPPTLLAPANSQVSIDGVYRCQQVTGALSYTLQISSDPNFPAARTLTRTASPSGGTAEAVVTLSTLFTTFSDGAGKPLYWRMGAHIDGKQAPVAFTDPNQQGWVYSQAFFFTLPAVPPPLVRGA